MENIVAKIKQHPYVAGIIIFVVGIIVLFYLRSGSSSTAATTTPGADPNVLAADVQLAQLNAQQTAASNQTAAQLQALSVQGTTQVALANITKTVDLAQINGNTDIAQIQANVEVHAQDTTLKGLFAQYNAQNTQTALATEAAIQEAQLAAATTISTVNAAAAENEIIAQTNSNTAIAGYNAQVESTKAVAGALTTSSIASSGFGFLGKLAGSIF